eukprot:CAMPEP_0178775060 /NCGR_PEP_ID=MMETSP0744-20121128/23983_1 /TAXON_ID=913974 /ORGANISM="Nitzschia punctata, Strain CCMP561" /LENGTH=180 /DNA_ID=CAMNT_0020431997 /DNA_START=13 /DNA_END=556 /DNA_ORIENTATION=-
MRFDFCGSQLGQGTRQVEQVKEAADFLLAGDHQCQCQSENSSMYWRGYDFTSTCGPTLAVHVPWKLSFGSSPEKWAAVVDDIGSKDNFTSEDVFMDIVHTMPKTTTTGAVLKEADHFFRGREQDLMDVMGHWILNVFPQCDGDLKKLSQAEFTILEPPALGPNISSESSFLGCNPCVSGD